VVDILSIQQLASLPFNRHPLGFAYVLVAKEDSHALRLHIWSDHDRYEQQPYWPIHNHKFDLISRVLSGRLTNRQYRVQPTLKKTTQRLFDITYESEGSIMSPSDIFVSVDFIGSEHITAPNSYRIGAGVFHDTFVPTGVFTATLVITRDSLRDADVKTVGDSGNGVRYKYVRDAIAGEEKNAIISKLGALL
jgi:hypothetical protein